MENSQEKYKIAALKSWVPQPVGMVIFILFGFFFQFSMSAYLANLEDITMGKQWSHEDIKMAFQVSLIGMAIIFPVLFRVKFRFKSKHILLLSISMVMLCSLISVVTNNLLVLIIASFFLGVFRMMGTFESFSNIQLFITPSRDMGIWFTFIYLIVLFSINGSGFVSVNIGFNYGWETMHYVMIFIHALMLLTTLVILKPIHFMKPVPFKGIDWRGAFLWSVLFCAVSYIFIYGQSKDWYNSYEIQMATVFAVLVTGVLLYSYKSVANPYIGAKVFLLKSIVTSVVIIFLLEFFINTAGGIIHPFEQGVMGLDSLSVITLNLFLIAGIILAAAFCFYWFKKINRSYKVLFFTGFLTLLLYHLLLGRVLTPQAGIEHLYLPYFFKGIGYLMIYAGVGKYMMRDVTFDTFPQGWFIVAIVRNTVGAPMVSAFITEIHHTKTLEYINKIATQLQVKSGWLGNIAQEIYFGNLMGGNSSEVAEKAVGGAFYGKIYLQALTLATRDIYNHVTIFGIIILLLILTHHFYGPFSKKFGDRFWKA